jgi:hypothetical protein
VSEKVFNITKQQIKQCFRQNMKVKDIALHYKCSKSLIYALCKKFKIIIPSIDLVGLKINKFTVIKKLGSRGIAGRQETHWLCVCDCGNLRELSTKILISKKNKSCGCWKRQKEYREKHHCWTGYEGIHGKRWQIIKTGAIKRGHKFNLSIQDAWKLYEKQNRKCAISGVDIYFAETVSTFSAATASLDRIDSTLGYTLDNVQWVHKEINLMKQGMSMKQFLEWIKIIGQYNEI